MTSWPAPAAAGPVSGRVVVPGSKSETNRALVLAALADGPSSVFGALDSRDARLMIHGLGELGAVIQRTDEVVRVTPPARFLPGGTIDCGLAGTVMRFLPPVALLTGGAVRFVGDAHASQRPIAGLLAGLNQLGADTDSSAIPFTLVAPDEPRSVCEIDASPSSQYVSGPLLVGARLPQGLTLRHTGKTLPSRPHIDMTVAMLRDRGVVVDEPDERTWVVRPGPIAPADAHIAPDLTNAAVFVAAAALTRGEVTIPHWPDDTTQAGERFLDLVESMGADVVEGADERTVRGTGQLRGVDIDLSEASELTPVVAALALFADGTTTIRGVGHIRGHETDRLAALAHEFAAAGAAVEETSDGLRIEGGRPLRPREFATYDDHRMAHAAALVGLMVPGTTLDDVSCTAKTMPTFPALWTTLCAR